MIIVLEARSDAYPHSIEAYIHLICTEKGTIDEHIERNSV